LDLSDSALLAAEKGFEKLMAAASLLPKLKAQKESTVNVNQWVEQCYVAMNDDFNTPILIAHLFEAVKMINSIHSASESINQADLMLLKEKFNAFVFDVLGLKNETKQAGNDELLDGLMATLIQIRQQAKDNKDWASADLIRNELSKLNISLKDTKEGTDWGIDK
jgi:cysteinyl-tRNA synthetase